MSLQSISLSDQRAHTGTSQNPDDGFVGLAREHLRLATLTEDHAERIRRLTAVLGPQLQLLFDKVARRVASTSETNEDGKLIAALGRYFSAVLNADTDQTEAVKATPTAESRRLLRELDLDAFVLELTDTLTDTAFTAFGHDLRLCRETVGALQWILLSHAGLLRAWAAQGDALPAVEQSDIDSGTGLPNHRALVRQLGALLQNWSGKSEVLALLVIDLKFSQLAADNEAYIESETLYAESARRLHSVLREADVAGRLSRHEFAAILPRISGEGLAILAANRILRAFEEPFEVNGRPALARLTIGISGYPEHGREAEELLHHAEIARDEAQKAQEPYAVYDRTLHRQDRMKRSLEALLRHALYENELEMYLQPQVGIASGRVVGAEALLRWRLDDDTYVPPQQIVAIAEESGLISALTSWVFHTALRHTAELRRGGIDISVSVNIAPSNLNEPELPDFVKQALDTWGVPADRLTIELTETAMIGDNRSSLENLHRLKRLGVQLSIDDFGTGYSCMAYLKRMPLNELKIDKTFISNMLSAQEDERIVRSVIDLAHHFELQVVAEGVEDKPTLQALRALGCDVAQGYLFERPMPAKQFAAWFEQHSNPGNNNGAVD
jgi:diguanylate cyclase (GGDEF)-like protein